MLKIKLKMGIQTPTPKDQMQFRFPSLVQNNNNEKYVEYEAVSHDYCELLIYLII